VTAVNGATVELEIWGEDPDGSRTTIGSAVVELSSQAS
jgi:hypothetical protein